MSSADTKVVNNHLIIGLGGTGGKIIRDLRKAIAADSRPNPDVNFEYLYLDSSKELMRTEDPTWKVLGRSVQLASSQQLLIEGAGMQQLLQDVKAYPNIEPWIGPLDVIQGVARTNVDSAQGGQRRKFGRFLFACNAKRFVGMLGDRVSELRKKKNSTLVTFHVCCGMAGGTGSGSLPDVVAQIRKAYPDPGDYRILIYALLPDIQPKANWNTGNYHANGYASLAELNALNVGAYRPADVAEGGRRLEQLNDPVFNGCYVFTNENETGVFVDVEQELPSIVADFIYQKTLGLRWEALARAENAENGEKRDEMSVDGLRNERNKRFLAFGIKRLVVPEEEIKEYLSYNFAQQATRQFMYNNWTEGLGFAAEPRPADFHSELAKPETQNRWRITDEHLTLSVGILPEDANNARWKRIPDFWSGAIPQHKQDIQNTVPQKQRWLDELRKRCDQIFDEGYRGLGGVKRFYETKLKAKSDIARFIRNEIERELFDDWRNGQKSLSEVSRTLAVLTEAIEERLTRVDERITKLRAQEEDVAARISNVVQEWAGINWFTDLLGKGQKLFNSASEFLTQLYVYRTYAVGWTFAKKLLEELNQQIIDLRTEVDRLFGTLSAATDEFDRQIAARLNDEPADMQAYKLRVYNRDAVRQVNQRLITDEGIQKQQTQTVRNRIVRQLGENDQSFTGLNKKLDAPSVLSLLESVSEENVVSAHDQLATEQRRVMNVNIVEKLYEDYGTNEEALVRFVKDVIGKSGVYLTFDDQEERKQGPGTDSDDKHIKTAGLFIPECKARPEFAARLEDLFKANKITAAFDVLKDGARSNEITLIRVDNLFPLRFVKPLRFLKQKYDERCASTPDAKYLLHGEGDGSDRPALFIPTHETNINAKRPYLVLGRALGLIVDRKSSATGRTETVYRWTDDDGLEQEEVLGKTFIEASDKVDFQRLGEIERLVSTRITEKANKHMDRRQELFGEAVKVINEVKESCGGDLQDETYKKFAATVKPIKQMLELEG